MTCGAGKTEKRVYRMGWGELGANQVAPRAWDGLRGGKLAASEGGWEGGAWESGRGLIQPEDQPHLLLLETRSSPSQKVTGRLWTWGISSAKMRPRPLSPQVAHRMLATGRRAVSMPPSPFRSGNFFFFIRKCLAQRNRSTETFQVPPVKQCQPNDPWVTPAAAAAAKSLQSCPTLCHPIDGSPSGSPRPWDSPGKNTGVGCYFLLQCMKWKNKVKSLSCVRLLATPWTAAHQTPPSMGFSRQEYWSGVPCVKSFHSALYTTLWNMLSESSLTKYL